MDTGLPAPFEQIGDGNTKEATRKIIAAVAAGYHTQHNPDDSHGTITSTGAISERGRVVPMGEWITIPYSSANFTGGGTQTWTPSGLVTLNLVQYMLVGKTMTVAFYIDNFSVGGVANPALFMTIPAHFQPSHQFFNTFTYSDNGTLGVGLVQVVPSSSRTQIQFQKDFRGSSNWTASASSSGVAGQLAFEVVVTN